MKTIITGFIAIIFSTTSLAQKPYNNYIIDYQKSYVKNHEVISKREDKKRFSFFAPDVSYKVETRVAFINDSIGFMMPTSGSKPKKFYRYALLRFSLKGKALQLTVYRSDALQSDTAYKDYVFLPFTDATSGEQSYGGGRYLDLDTKDIVNHTLIIDFNKAYNPYCAYAKGYNCPIPPRENDLPIAIEAGEMNFLDN